MKVLQAFYHGFEVVTFGSMMKTCHSFVVFNGNVGSVEKEQFDALSLDLMINTINRAASSSYCK